MRNLFYLMVILTVYSSCTSCRRDRPLAQTDSVDFTLITTYNEAPFVIGDSYLYQPEESIQINQVAFFLDDLSLIKENETDVVSLREIDYINVNQLQFDDLSANIGYQTTYEAIPIGKYSGIRFGIGVSPELNNQTPEDFSSHNHPLGDNSRYATEASSYIFGQLSGFINKDTDHGFLIETTTDSTYIQVSLPFDFQVAEGQENSITIHFDLLDIFKAADQSQLNIFENDTIMQPGAPMMDWVLTNWRAAFSVQ